MKRLLIPINAKTQLFTLCIAFLLLSSSAVLVSCSDSEKKLPYFSPVTKVIINLGNSSQKSSSRKNAEMPTDITSILLTVTGADMAPITQNISPLQSIIELNVPSGLTRNFTAVAQSPSTTYVGNTVATLPAGQTVSVPIVMVPTTIPPIFQAEGTPDEPVQITVNASTPHVGMVNTGRSYYYATNPGTYDYFVVKVTYMSGDVDLIGFGNDNNFTTSDPSTFGENYCGRLKNESIDASAYTGNYYFVIDGSHTQIGAAYTVECVADNYPGEFQYPLGTISDPMLIPVGYAGSSNASRLEAETNNYFMAQVDIGRQYWINTYDYSASLTTIVYNNPLFTIPILNNPVTPTSNLIFFTELGYTFDDRIINVITADEGTTLQPIDLSPAVGPDNRRANYCMVGTTSSYYRFPVDPDLTYNLFLAYEHDSFSITNNISLYIYDDPLFMRSPLYSFVDSSNFEYFSIGQFIDGYCYVRVVDYPDVGAVFNGSTFILDIAPQ